MGVDFPPLFARDPAGIDGHHRALGAEPLRRLADKLRPLDRRRIDGNLVGARIEEPPDIVDRPHPPADGERHEHPLGGAAHHVDDDVALVARGGDIEEGELVGALPVVHLGNLHRIAGIAQFEELDPLDHPPPLHVETGDNTFRQHVNTTFRLPDFL